MFKNSKIFIIAALLFSLQSALAQQINVNALHYWNADKHTSMVFELAQKTPYNIFLLANPARLIIDFKNAKLKRPLAQPAKNHALFSRIRIGTRNKNNLRVVADLKTAVNQKSFFAPPNKSQGHRLVVKVTPKHAVKKATKTVTKQARDIVIAIDAGHGGIDPGARGARGTQEKKVVLDIAKKLTVLIDAKPGLKAVMVRKGDYRIKLRRRMEIARKAKADLFVSIHADAFRNKKAKGASVFTVSNRGASSEAARWLADHENSADLVGGVTLSDKENILATVLMDLSQTATKEVSRNVAVKILKNFKRIGHLHKNSVQKAGFVVLKSPDIPSILIETAFISNPNEEKRLRSSRYQKKIAKAIFKGVVAHFEQYPPVNTYFALNAKQRHVIASGETLSGIAFRYGVSMRAIKVANALSTDAIRVGQVLKIPKG